MLHGLIYGIIWYRLKEWQEEATDKAQQGGRQQGEYVADAWGLQAQIEEAQLGDKNLVGAFLDYEKLIPS